MSIKQESKVSPPLSSDLPALSGFSSVVQGNLSDLFQAAHRHFLGNTSTVPANNSGSFGDIIVVDKGTGNKFLYIRFTDGWHYIQAT